MRPKPEGRFDAFSVAARQAVVAGHVDATRLARVADMLAADGEPAQIDYRITGGAAAGHPALEVALAGSVPLVCQRCLQPFRWPVEQETTVLLARDDQELARIDDEDHEHEVILAAAPVDPLELVEDELLLTLPFAPRCPEAVCEAARGARAVEPASPDAGTPSAFDVLAGLKTGGAGKKSPR
jgi:uncharacterized protein